MGKGFFDKIVNSLVGEDVDEFENGEEVDEEVDEEGTEPIEIASVRRNNKVVNIHSNASTKIIIYKPEEFREDAMTICEHLKNRKIIVVNVYQIERTVAQRLLDYIGGASFVLGAEIQEVGKGIYIISPSNVEVSNSFKYELQQNKEIFGFMK
ncbi:MAG: cell division protein SepF [Clostridium sp.]